jgi:hypothetical protein
MKFPLSIFNFEQKIEPEIPRHWWASIGLLVGILALAEASSRVLLQPVGDNLWAYNPPSLSRPFEWYRHLTEENMTPTVLAIGDSTGARNFDPESFAATSSIDNAYNLAHPGNFPLALRSNTLPLLDSGHSPDIVILFQWPGSLLASPRVDKLEAGAMSPILEARRTGRFNITDYIYLTRIYRARGFVLDYWLRGKTLLKPPVDNGFAPLSRPAAEATTDRPADPPEQQQFEFSEERRSVITRLSDLAKEHQFLLVAVVGPFRWGDRYQDGNRHLDWLRELEKTECENLVVMDLRNLLGDHPEFFKGNHHLYRDGAEVFSARLGKRIARLHEQFLSGRNMCTR